MKARFLPLLLVPLLVLVIPALAGDDGTLMQSLKQSAPAFAQVAVAIVATALLGAAVAVAVRFRRQRTREGRR